MEASGVQHQADISDSSQEKHTMSAKETAWWLVALIVVVVLAVIFVLIGMKLAWIGG